MRVWALAAVAALAQTSSASWIEDPVLRQETEARVGQDVGKLTVNLDLPPKQRWLFVKSNPAFVNYKKDVIGYVSKFVPKWSIPILATVVSTLHTTFYPDYADEMDGLASALDLSLGEVVLINLIYQLEGIATSCEAKNTTGPCPSTFRGPGLCTGVVANQDGDTVWHGRNLDWNLDASVLKYVMQVDYQRSNQTVFSGVQVVGMVGIIHGVKKGGFSVQVNARDDGGNVFLNIMEQILAGGKEPTHHLRRAFEDCDNFTAAEQSLSGGHLANPVYFIMAGARHGEGSIVTRARQSTVDVWHLYEAPAKDTKGLNKQPDWMRLQTNYDHWTAVPSFDDRRTPGVNHTQVNCAAGLSQACMEKTMMAWPTKNFHTDVTSIMCPQTGYMSVAVWPPSSTQTIVV